MDTVNVRFAPSPTGHLHIGGARTALFNWLYARHTGGKFILRIEDTDRVRSEQKFVDIILESLSWLKLDWDDGPYLQRDRVDVYDLYLNELLNSGHAYYCQCSRDEVDVMRKKALAIGLKPKYDGSCRGKKIAKSKGCVIRFKAPIEGITVVDDVVKGKVFFRNDEQDDFVICRSDGTPTYNFVVVVDDITMKITTVIRGDDHLMNTPKQIMLYNAFRCLPPIFVHVPMVLGKDRTRFSKRNGDDSIMLYRDMGLLPDAIINYLVRLGWSYGDQEFFTRKDLIEKFTLNNISKSSSIFDLKKLITLNAKHIRSTPIKDLSEYVIPFMIKDGYRVESGRYLSDVISTLYERNKTLADIAQGASFYYTDTVEPYNEAAAKKFLQSDILEPVLLLVDQIANIDVFDEKSQKIAFDFVMKNFNLSFGELAQPIRVALTGNSISPSIFDIMRILGKEIVLSRLESAINFIRNKVS